MTHNFETDSWPYIQAKNYRKANRKVGDVRVVVIHDMEAPEKNTTAEAVARYFATTSRPASAHINVDNDSIVQCVWDKDIAYAAPGCNHDGIQIELAGYARQTRAEWLDAYSKAVLELAARATAQYCLKFHLPVKKLSVAELKAGHKGIVGHVDVSNAYKKSSHYDPGKNFPWDYFIERVKFFYDKYLGKKPSTPTKGKRYSMVFYGKRGTPDYDVAAAVANASGRGVVTADLDEAKAAVARGEKVIALGGPAARELGFKTETNKVKEDGNKVAIVGQSALDSLVLAGNYLK